MQRIVMKKLTVPLKLIKDAGAKVSNISQGDMVITVVAEVETSFELPKDVLADLTSKMFDLGDDSEE